MPKFLVKVMASCTVEGSFKRASARGFLRFATPSKMVKYCYSPFVAECGIRCASWSINKAQAKRID